MDAAPETNQRIAKLTPLADVLALIAREIRPAAPRYVAAGDALHRVLAADAIAPALPTQALALIDGWALAAETTRDASGFAPVRLPAKPMRVEAGQPLPSGADAVAPFDAVTTTSAGAAVLAAVNPGDGVLPAGGDGDGKQPLRRAGDNLRAIDIAALAAAGMPQVNVRTPSLCLVARDDTVVAAAARLIAADFERCGAETMPIQKDLRAALAGTAADFVVGIGGTGNGRNDANVRTLANEGRLVVHGIGVTPGETAALGFAGVRPVLLLPGRLDAALAVWLTVGRPILRNLTNAAAETAAATLTLSRKIASAVGLAEVIPVRRAGDMAEPLAAQYLSLSALARSDGYVVVPAASEGYSAGSLVSVRPWP